MIRAALTKYYRWKFRKQDPDVCCCGSYEKDHGYSDNHGFVSMVDHAVRCAVDDWGPRAALLRIATRRPPDFIVGEPSDPYLQRWHVIPRNDWLNIYLHQFLHSDDDRALHTHPYRWNVSWLLRGSYWEWITDGWKVRESGAFVFRWGASPHRIELHRGPCWTLFITGRRVREWGFICPQGWRHWSVFTKPGSPGERGRGCE